MKKKFLLFLMVLTMLLALTFGFAACTDTDNGNGGDAYYTVRFNDNYSNKVTKVDVEAGKTVELIQAPTRMGYIFKGWYLSYEDDATEQFDATKAINGNVTVYAKWEKDETVNIVTLKFLNYTTIDEVYTVPAGTVFTQPADPKYDENETYLFEMWCTDEAGNNAFDFSTVINEDITLYAGWKQDKVTVMFDVNYSNGPAVPSAVVKLGQNVEEPEDPVREKYSFIGWYTSKTGGTAFDFDTPIESDITLYAQWERSEFDVTFDLNGGTLTSDLETVYTINRGESAQEIADALVNAMTFVGHDFVGWYNVDTDPNADDDQTTSANIVDLTTITSDLVVYAKWSLQEYEVTFNYNYPEAPQAPEAQTVKYGRTATSPEVETREGYLFVGWFKEAEGTTQFTFDMTVTEPMTLYAKWVEETQTVTEVTVTYYYGVSGTNEVYATKTVAYNNMASTNLPEDPSVKDYYFAGWYTDEEYTTAFNTNMNLIEDVNVYAKLLKKYTFEAEATDFTGKTGQGTSTNSVEEQMIMDHTFIKDGSKETVSNGYFVRELYYNGGFIDFEVTAEEECDDAVIYLRVSSESYEFFTTKEKDGVTYNYLSDQEFLIYLNGDVDNALEYGGLYMPMANLDEKEDLAQNKTPFEDMFIAVNVHLNEGRNVITLEVANNNNHGGTFHAEAPIIDCMYIYSSVELSSFDYEFYNRDNVQRG